MDNSCLRCGHENRPKAKFCANCGQTLSAAIPVAGGVDNHSERVAEVISAPLTAPAAPPAATAAPPRPEAAPLAAEALVTADEVITPLDVASEPGAPQDSPTTVTRQATEPVPGVVHSVVAGENEPTPANLAEPGPDDPVEHNVAEDEATEGLQEPASAPSDALAADPALAAGTLIAERYLVVSYAEASPGQNVYQVEDHGVCRSCGAVVQATDEEPYCFNCGAHLLQSTLPWPLRALREVTVDPDNATLFTWQAHTFIIENAVSIAQASPFTSGVNLLVGQRSHVGVGRANAPDEDSILALTLTGVYESKAQPTVGLYVVADGMGGHGDGEVASRIATETIATALLPTLLLPLVQGQTPPSTEIVEQLNRAIQMANQRIHEGARARNNDMGTTLTLALIVNDQVYVANVGDSRTYLWGQRGLCQITQDHSHVYSLYKNGALTEEGIYTHPRRNEIYRSLGIGNTVTVDHFQEQLTPGDLLLLCCDGLWEMVRNDGITDVLMLNLGEPQIICDELVGRANVAGGEDNISIVVVRAVA